MSEGRLSTGRYYKIIQDQVFVAKWCGDCGNIHFYYPEDLFCDRCGSYQTLWRLLSTEKSEVVDLTESIESTCYPYTGITRKL